MQYTKDNKIIEAGTGFIIVGDTQIFNPTEEQLKADGWVEYIPPQPVQPTEEELVEQAKNRKLYEIEMYDKSEAVNQFFLAGQPMWLTEPERDQAQKRFERDVKKGLSSTTLYWHDNAITLDPNQGLVMLDRLTEYANKAYDNTMQHRINVIEMAKDSLLDDINSYDYKSGYPEKLKFEVV